MFQQHGYGQVIPALFHRTPDRTSVIARLWQIMTICRAEEALSELDAHLSVQAPLPCQG
jgi:hypothetical protein